MARGKKSSFGQGRGKARKNLSVEPLESREMLAADLGIDSVAPSNDPFAHNAFSVDEISLRAETTPYAENELVVAFNFGSTARKVAASIDDSFWSAELSEATVSSWDTSLEYQRDNGSVIMVVDLTLESGVDPVNVMKQLGSHSDIAWSSPNFLYEGDPRELIPNDTRYDEQYHHSVMQNDLAWDVVGFGSSDIVIAVTDDGVSLNHSDLVDNIWQNPGEIAGDNIDNDGNGFVDDISGWSFINGNNDPNPSSQRQHGTHVAGVAAGRADNNIGIAGTAGNATIMPVQFFDYGVWPADVVRDSFVYAADNGAHIINTSYNIDIWVGDPVFTAGVQYAHDAGVLYFNSAGNSGDTNPIRQEFEQTLLVASTESTDALSGFSNRGTGIDIAAPGRDILSTVPGNSYDFLTGTSQSTPNAAGVAALIWSQNPTWNSFQVAAQLIGTADNIDAQNPALVGLVGGGRVNSFQAVTQTLAAPQVKATPGIPANGAQVEDVTIDAFSLQFDGVLDPTAASDPNSFVLTNAGADSVFDTADDESVPLNVTSLYMVGSNDVDLELAGGGSLEAGDYRLRITSGGIADPFGTPLDGNGDGVGGDDYETFFSVANPFNPEGPDSGLISKRTDVSATLDGAGDSDVISFFAEAGETVTAVATPVNGAANLTLTIPSVSDATSASPGDTVILPIATIPADGQYEFVVNGDAATAYSLEIYRNVDVTGLFDGAAVDLNDSEIDLGGSRYAALATADGIAPGVSLSQYSSASSFIDISATGTALNLSDDGEANITSSVGNLLMPSGPMTIGNNGVVAQGRGVSVNFLNDSIPTPEFDAALMPFWDDIDDDSGNVYWEERVVDGINTLIVQWDSRPHFSNTGDSTFQVQLFDTGSVLARYAYEDVDFGTAQFNGGASATIGAQSSSAEGYEFSNNQATVSSGDVIDVISDTPTNDVDEFTVGLSAVGQNVDIILDGTSSLFSGATVELLDPSGNVVATASETSSSFELGILGYTVSQAGQHTVRVTAGLSGQYYLMVNESLAYATEPDNTIGTARSLSGYSAAIGSFSGAVSSDRADIFGIDVVQGQTVAISTSTPFDDPRNEPLNNQLDVAIAVRDSADNILVSDLDSAADGRNATLNFTSGFTGTAYVSVFRESGAGDYVLSVGEEVNSLDGDFDNDGDYDCNDIDFLVGEIAGNTNNADFDLTGDGVVNLDDRDAWLAEAATANELSSPYQMGDANLDGFVDVSDFNEWNQNKFTNTAAWCAGDFSADGAIDVSDFNLWNSNKFTSSVILASGDADFANPKVATRTALVAVTEQPATATSPVLAVSPVLAGYSIREFSSANRNVDRSSLIDRVFAATDVDLEDDRLDVI